MYKLINYTNNYFDLIKKDLESEGSMSESSDAEEDGDEMDEDADEAGPPPAKQARLSKGELYKPPTNEELHQLKETENLYQSSLFRLQVCAQTMVWFGFIHYY